MSSALLIWRHPEQTIELSVAGRRERVWTIEINGLASEHVHRLVFTCQLVVRQVWMKIQCRDVVEKTKLVDVPEGTQWSNLLRAFHDALGAVPRCCALEHQAPSSASEYIAQIAAGAARACHRDEGIPPDAAPGR